MAKISVNMVKYDNYLKNIAIFHIEYLVKPIYNKPFISGFSIWVKHPLNIFNRKRALSSHHLFKAEPSIWHNRALINLGSQTAKILRGREKKKKVFFFLRME